MATPRVSSVSSALSLPFGRRRVALAGDGAIEATGTGAAPVRLDAIGKLAQYDLLVRIATPGLTLVVLQRDPRLADVLLLIVPLMMALNFVALRRWTWVVRTLRVSSKPFYLGLDLALALTVLLIVGDGAPMVLYLPATGLLTGLIYRARLAIVASLVSTAGYVLILVSGMGYVPGDLDFHTTVTLPSLLLSAGAAGVALRRLLVSQQQQAAQLSDLREAAAVRDERLRMARDLHDSLTKNLHGVWLLSRTLEGALDRGDVGPARSAARVIGQTAQGLTGEARQVISGLRDSDAGTVPLADALRGVAERVVAGHPVALEVRDLRGDAALEPSPAARHELIAVAAESLHNALKHAEAHRLEVRLEDSRAGLAVVVRDDGRGFDPGQGESMVAAGHFGLLGMKERAARAGGRVSVTSAPGSGTAIRMVVPASREG